MKRTLLTAAALCCMALAGCETTNWGALTPPDASELKTKVKEPANALAKDGIDYRKVDNRELIAMQRAMATGTPAEAKELHDKIIANPGAYAPTLLMVMGDRMVRDGDEESGLFWFHAGRLRLGYDIARLNDPSLADKVPVISLILRSSLEASLKDTARLSSVLEKVYAWDASTPYEYDFTYLAGSSAGAYAAALDSGNPIGPKPVPQDQWPDLHEKTVQNYKASMQANIDEINKAGGFEKIKAAAEKQAREAAAKAAAEAQKQASEAVSATVVK